MQVREIMTDKPACCSPDTPMRDAAQMMADSDCGEIPVLDRNNRPVGVITDRDIACRGVAKGKSADDPVSDLMSSPVVTVTPETSVDDCCRTMEENQVRRVPVVDESGSCCGIVAQADIALDADGKTGEVVREISEPTEEASRVGCC